MNEPIRIGVPELLITLCICSTPFVVVLPLARWLQRKTGWVLWRSIVAVVVAIYLFIFIVGLLLEYGP
jgi:hypothetical protein